MLMMVSKSYYQSMAAAMPTIAAGMMVAYQSLIVFFTFNGFLAVCV
jgi:hypothetical protein